MHRYSLLGLCAASLSIFIPVACTSSGDLFGPTTGPGTGGGDASGSSSTTGSGSSSTGMGGMSSSSSAGPGGSMMSSGGSMMASSSSTTASSSASGMGGMAASSSSSGGGTEDCTNKVDDNGDNLVDCADPQCSAFVCQHQPATWQGPVILYDGAPGTAPNACPAEYDQIVGQLFRGLVPEDAMCGPCGCDLPDVDCQFSQNIAVSASCQLPGNNQGQSTNCSAINPGSAFTAKTPSASAGNCQPNGGAATVPPPNWTAEALVCGNPSSIGGGCGSDACVPKPPLPFEAGVCVVRQGIHSCPNFYPNQNIYVTGAIDSRDCSMCQCEQAAQPTCRADTDVYIDDSCTSLLGQVPDDSSCHTLLGAGKSVKVTTTVTGNPGCNADPTTGQPIGGIVENGMFVTVCCTP